MSTQLCLIFRGSESGETARFWKLDSAPVPRISRLLWRAELSARGKKFGRKRWPGHLHIRLPAEYISTRSEDTKSFAMVTKSKLKLALSAEKGIDWHKLQQKKKQKDAERRKRKASTVGGPADSEGDAEETDEDEVHEQVSDQAALYSFSHV
jgi:hypothetical protein